MKVLRYVHMMYQREDENGSLPRHTGDQLLPEQLMK